jgi:hypothetical protein
MLKKKDASSVHSSGDSMHIHTHSSHRPWEGGLKLPTRTQDMAPNSDPPIDTFQAAPKEKHEFPLLGAALLTLTAVTGFVAGQATALGETEAVVESCQESQADVDTVDLARNPDDWKADIGGRFQPGKPSKSRPGKQAPQSGKKSQQGQTRRTDRGAQQNPDDWKAELGGKAANESSQSSESKSTESSRSDDYQNPDDWKADIGGRYTPSKSKRREKKSTNRESSSTRTDSKKESGGYENPDDWKSGF